MTDHPRLIVMLTHHDRTVENARELFARCVHSKAEYWGFKELPLPPAQMKALCGEMKAAGKTTFLEVVAYTEAEGLAGAQLAAECGFDVLLGTVFFDSINDFCRARGLRYMPFVGKVSGRPSVLEGTPEELIAQARDCLSKGVYGFDLLGYRHQEDPCALNEAFVRAIDAPVCIAGSIDSYARLDEVKRAGPWCITIGGAFFEEKFGSDLCTQVDTVIAYLETGA